ncbi:50S ribosomal protein L13 [Chitinivibrio alkaliphilus]|uniref:Large ribosomal subunit protein uL13 n=1 Tax=Chitinivibrio alkaliphilus ACht1 TaxID=1313304 RepID=U7D340_9BACT|nr:50S ribosomal protein L13 [Chitinivibrio alkaliphilus]ERP30914.1 50S ribosomal protein L13 [Chitinivibrio alkaliphilus ACht1]
MKTKVFNHKTIERKWYVVDATDMVLGRMASKVAQLLIGKSKPAYSPNQDHGDHVIVINADKITLTGRKADSKYYFRHSTYPGGEKIRTFREQMELDSTKVIRDAVHGMVPKTALGRSIEKKLHVYAGSEHNQAAQKPEPITL